MEKGIVKLNPEIIELIHNGGGANILPFRQEIFVICVHIAGIGYSPDILESLKNLRIGDSLTLKRDPKNEYDSYAISIEKDKKRLGWVPMTDNTVIANLMDAGKLFRCKVVEIKEREEKKWTKVMVDIFMVE